MPKYCFECQVEACRVSFERTLSIGEHPTHPCPKCGEPAPRVLADEGFGFSFSSSPSAATANTGVHKDDYPTADQIVGREAEHNWGVIHRREKVKEEARGQGGTHALIRHDGEGFIDYEPMSDGGRVARRNLAKRAVEALRNSKPDS